VVTVADGYYNPATEILEAGPAATKKEARS
jgi:hypothetical protein